MKKPNLDKKKSRKKKWRHVYPYECNGCHKRRIAFVHERAKLGLCKRCEPVLPDPNQATLL